MQNSVVVLDFGSENISAVMASRGVNGTLQMRGAAEVRYSGFFSSEFLDESELKVVMGTAINQLESAAKCAIDEVYVGVPAEFLACFANQATVHLQKPRRVTVADVEEVCAKAYKKPGNAGYVFINKAPVYFALGDSRRVVDPVGQTTDRLTGLISFLFASSKFVHLVQTALKEMGVRQVNFVAAPLAQALYLTDIAERDRYSILIDVGYITTSAALIMGEGILGLAAFSMGSGNITADLAEGLRIKFKDAQQLKKKMVLSLTPAPDDCYNIETERRMIPVLAAEANEIAKARVGEIASYLLKSFQSFNYDIPISTNIYLTGGGLTELKGAKDFLSKALARPLMVKQNPNLMMRKPKDSSILSVVHMALLANDNTRRKRI